MTHHTPDDDAAARLLRTAANDPRLRAVLGVDDDRPVVDINGRRLDIDADLPDDIIIALRAMMAARPPADDVDA